VPRSCRRYRVTPLLFTPAIASRRRSKQAADSGAHQMQDKLPPGITLVQADNFETWLVDLVVLDQNPIYEGEKYRLKFTFGSNYPIEVRYRHDFCCIYTHLLIVPHQAPEVVFVKDSEHPIPWHPHIYTNGIICLDLLDKQGWSPVHNVESVCVSLQSMLTSNTKKERPPGDENFVKYNTQRPRDINFVFHDNQV
jgi:ubiquitin-conjugating enzyme E2 W